MRPTRGAPKGLHAPRDPARSQTYRFGRFGRVVTDARLRAGYTIPDLAAELGVSKRAVSAWGRGVYVPKHEHATALAALLEDPHILAAAWEHARTSCAHCGTEFYRQPGFRARGGRRDFCGSECHHREWQKEEREHRRDTRKSALQVAHKRIGSLTDKLDQSEQERRRMRETFREMCKACEWDEVCKTADCPIQQRGDSPFRLAEEAVA